MSEHVKRMRELLGDDIAWLEDDGVVRGPFAEGGIVTTAPAMGEHGCVLDVPTSPRTMINAAQREGRVIE